MKRSMGFVVLCLLLSHGACSSEQGGVAGTQCVPDNGDCTDDAAECCTGSICTISTNRKYTCSPTCETNSDCDSNCCHGLNNSPDKVCDVVTACDSAGTGGVGGSGGTGAAGTAGGGSGGVACNDNSATEPNQTEADAVQLADTTDCNDNLLQFSDETLGPNDVDWFTFFGTDDICDTESYASISTGAEQLRICAFADIVSGCDVVCTTGSAETSPLGTPGCCSSGVDPIVEWDTTCAIGESASAQVFIRIDNPVLAGCTPYDLAYRF